MRGWLVAIACASGCGRLDFSAAIDAGSVDSMPGHVQVAPGWRVTLLVDLTGVVPYRVDDFEDGTNEILDNGPNSLAALYSPFTGELAIGAGRSIIEVAANGATSVHDYRPAAPDTTGPDDITHLVFGIPADTGPELWIGTSSQGGGDGVYDVAPDTWQITRDATNNNVNGIAWDATGAYDSTAVPAIYFVDSTAVYRRTGPAAGVSIFPENDTFEDLEVSATALFALDQATTTSPVSVVRVFAATHTEQTIVTSTDFRVAVGGPLATTTVAVIRDDTTLATYAADGTSQDLAWTTDPSWFWVNACVPQAPHRLAGGYVVLESNRALDRDELLLVAPSQ